MIVVGGGATGLGTAVEAASRGYRTLLLEQSDFAKGTSSRSTKLIHGGLRYLQQGDVGLVREAATERYAVRKLRKDGAMIIRHSSGSRAPSSCTARRLGARKRSKIRSSRSALPMRASVS
jgi:glycerol-3-phosphate dehydrogenase